MKLIISTLAACAVAGLVYIGVIKEDKYVVFAELTDAGGILKNYDVKIGEVPAGSIKDITLKEDDTVVIRMEIDPAAGPIGEGASADVRPVNLLGEKYVDLDVGDLSKPQPDGTVIPKERTDVPVELDDVLNVLDPDTRAGMKLIINEFGVAVAGRGSDFNGVLEDLPPALDEAEEVVGEVAEENIALREAIDKGDRVLASVVAGKDDLGEMVTAAAETLDVVADKRQRLGETVRTAPGTLNQLRSTLANLQTTATDLTPAARDLRTATPALADTLERLPAFADDAEATLDAATDVAPTLEKLGQQSTPTLRLLQPTVDRLAQFSTDIAPFATLLGNPDKSENGSNSFLNFIDGWAGLTGTRDSLGHLFRLRLTLDEETITSGLERNFGLPASQRSRRAKEPEKRRATPEAERPAPSAPTPAPSAPSGPVQGVADRLPKVGTVVPGPVGESVDRAIAGVGQAVDGVVKGLTDGVGKALDPNRRQDGGKPSGTGDAKKLLDYLLGS